MKAKGPAAAKVEEEKKKGLALFGPKPPTPKLLRAFGGNINKTIIEKMKVTALTSLTCHICMSHQSSEEAMLLAERAMFLHFFSQASAGGQ